MVLPLWLSKRKDYCSKLCNGARVRRETDAKMLSVCIQCNKAFRKDHASLGSFCSKKCYWESLKIYGEKPSCIDCGKQLISHKSKRCAKCSANFRVGENHHNWKGGISNRDIHSLNNPRYVEWRMKVFARDNFKCRIANKDCSGVLQAHHILRWSEFPELRYKPNNGIALCQVHHPRRRAEEKRLAPMFMGLVSVSNRPQFH